MARRLQSRGGMQPTTPQIVLMPANDLPQSPNLAKARRRERERRLRGPIWAEPKGDLDVA